MKQMTFQKLEGSVVILCKRGVYSQHEAWTRADEVFVKTGSGFLGMRREGTSVTDTHLIDYDLGEAEDFYFTDTGRLVLKAHSKASKPADSVKSNNNKDAHVSNTTKEGQKTRSRKK